MARESVGSTQKFFLMRKIMKAIACIVLSMFLIFSNVAISTATSEEIPPPPVDLLVPPPPPSFPPDDYFPPAPVILPEGKAVEISGTVRDAVSKAALGGKQDTPDQWAGLFLYKKNPDGTKSFVAASDCYETGNGCLDTQGEFSFGYDFEGNSLSAGNYHLVAFAVGYHIKRQDLGDIGAGARLNIEVALQPHAIRIELVSEPKDIPSAGGPLVLAYQLTNASGTDLKVRVSVEVLTQVNGISIRVPVREDSRGRKLKYDLRKGETKLVTQQVSIPADVSLEVPFTDEKFAPVILFINVVNTEDEWDALGALELSIQKGDFSDLRE
jgi:hypothetical protein